MESIIQVRHLKKFYKKHPAVNDVSFDVQKGQTFALLGPNGAGKSTVMNILSTSLCKSSGQITIDGLNPEKQLLEIRKRIGMVFQNGVLDPPLTVEENLYIRGSFYDLKGKNLEKRILKIAQMTGISNLLHHTYGTLSGGQKRRCDIARSLLPLPNILFLDEPATGLDPEIRICLWNTIEKIKKETGMTVLLTTHHMEEAALADHILVMKEGKIAASGSPSMLKDTFARDALPLLNLYRGSFSAFDVPKGSMEHAYLSIIEGSAGYA